MLLGATVTGQIEMAATPVVDIPASALTRVNQQPAVWVVDPASMTVSPRNIEVERFDPGTVAVVERPRGRRDRRHRGRAGAAIRARRSGCSDRRT